MGQREGDCFTPAHTDFFLEEEVSQILQVEEGVESRECTCVEESCRTSFWIFSRVIQGTQAAADKEDARSEPSLGMCGINMAV